MFKQGLELKQTQKLSPLQIQTIKLIELPIQELEQRVKAELEENPVLDDSPAPEKEDRDDEPRDVSIDEMDADDPIPSYKLSSAKGRSLFSGFDSSMHQLCLSNYQRYR